MQRFGGTPERLRAIMLAAFLGVTMAVYGCGGDDAAVGTTPPPDNNSDDGGDGDINIPGPGPITPPGPVEFLQQKTSFSDEEIRHFLRRTHFGVNPTDFARVKAIGMPAYVDEIMVFQTGTAAEQAADALVRDKDFPTRTELARWWLTVMTETENAFQEALAFFWHDHFATATDVLGASNLYWYFDHIKLLRTGGVGNFKDFVFDISIDWTELRWLDGIFSTVFAPNENFARELWELFTLGADNGYTQADIQEAARALTGYRIRTNPTTGQAYIEYDPNRHDTGNKTILGQTLVGRSGPSSFLEYQDVIDITFTYGEVAEFIGWKLWEYFAHPDPKPELVKAIAAKFRAVNWELKPLMRTLFLSEDFYSTKSRERQVKSPIEYVVGFIRSTGLQVPMNLLDLKLTNLGQRPTMPPGVNGWVTGELWLSTQGVIERTNVLRDAVFSRAYQSSLGISLDPILPPPGTRTPERVLTWLTNLLEVRLSAAEETELVTYLNSAVTPAIGGGWTRSNSPFDGDNAQHIDERVRGLLYILGQHPDFYLR